MKKLLVAVILILSLTTIGTNAYADEISYKPLDKGDERL